MLIQGILYCTVKYISIVLQKNLNKQVEVSPIGFWPKVVHILFVGIIYSMETICKLKIYHTVIWPV